MLPPSPPPPPSSPTPQGEVGNSHIKVMCVITVLGVSFKVSNNHPINFIWQCPSIPSGSVTPSVRYIVCKVNFCNNKSNNHSFDQSINQLINQKSIFYNILSVRLPNNHPSFLGGIHIFAKFLKNFKLTSTNKKI